MTTLQQKLQYFDLNQFNQDNEGFIDIMYQQLIEQSHQVIDDDKECYEKIIGFYKQYHNNGQKMINDSFKRDFQSFRRIINGRCKIMYIDKMNKILQNLKRGIEREDKDEINQYMYEVFAFKKKYVECLFAIQGKDVEESEFDLRYFDDFTGLNLAQNYQSIPINSKSLTNNNIAAQPINYLDSLRDKQNKKNGEQQTVKKLISENKIEKIEKIKIIAQNQNCEKERVDQGNITVIGQIKIQDSDFSLYSYSKIPKEGQQLYMFQRPGLSSNDLPIQQSFTCTTF